MDMFYTAGYILYPGRVLIINKLLCVRFSICVFDYYITIMYQNKHIG